MDTRALGKKLDLNHTRALHCISIFCYFFAQISFEML